MAATPGTTTMREARPSKSMATLTGGFADFSPFPPAPAESSAAPPPARAPGLAMPGASSLAAAPDSSSLSGPNGLGSPFFNTAR